MSRKSANPQPGKATKLRKEGNELYAQAQFELAAIRFKKASSLDETDPLPLRSLSSAQFEAGKYSECVDTIKLALRLETDIEKIETLKVRRVKCLFYQRKWDRLAEQLRADGLESKAVEIAEASEQYLNSSNKLGWKEVIELPRTRPFGGVREYFSHGHDQPVGAYSEAELLKTKKNGAIDLSILYGGIGDGRHFVQQLNDLASYLNEKESQNLDDNGIDKLDFVLQDIKQHTIARVLMILRTLNDMATIQNAESQTEEGRLELEEMEAMASYIHTCELMPPWIYDRMRKLMKTLLADSKIVDGETTFGIPWLRVSEATASLVKRVFRLWLMDTKGVVKEYDAKKVYEVECLEEERFEDDYLDGDQVRLAELEQFRFTRVLYPPMGVLKEKEPELYVLLAQARGEAQLSRRKKLDLKRYVMENWRTNVTIIQEAESYSWSKGNRIGAMLARGLHPGMDTQEVWEAANKAYKKLYIERQRNAPKAGLIEIMQTWFSLAARALGKTGLEISVRLEVGEITQQMDNYLLTERRFDSIYLSNIPDYTGGHLSTTIYALPLLRQSNSGAYVQSNILFNTSFFPNGLSETISEYMCLPTHEIAKNLLGLSFQKRKEVMEKYARQDPRDPYSMWTCLTTPHRWEHQEKNPFILPNKTWFLRWLAQIFLKVIAPVNRDYFLEEFRTLLHIEQPTTLYTFLRLCIYLINVRGIPSHWISVFLDQIIRTGKLPAAVFAPDSAPLSRHKAIDPYWGNDHEVELHQYQIFDVRPCMPELLCLVTIFLNVLPVSLLTTRLLPSVSSLRRCTLEAETYAPILGPWMQVLGLVLLNPRYVHWAQLYREEWLRDQLVNGKQKQAGDVVAENIILISNFKWTHVKTVVGFAGVPHRGGVAEWIMAIEDWERVKREGWKLGMIRTDCWKFMGNEHSCEEVKVEKMFKDDI
ncbi:hypothetical protein BJ508DRAFT_330154 [Ascobolus immersus RN42]|uniref:DUF4470 domain-containing protein n=1 Tax=Ascobolus immersus RN42 TaxID=1160509 RepID=A0A3N4HUC9_ASCIM|nr:hypothetical protein BJ508DRAFT_330154 [Ascobolus immersus RN42]